MFIFEHYDLLPKLNKIVLANKLIVILYFLVTNEKKDKNKGQKISVYFKQ